MRFSRPINDAMKAVVESGRLADAGLTTMLHRKLDWTDLGGVRWLLDQGVDPNALSAWGDRALHHALARDNALGLLDTLLDYGADPTLRAPWHDGLTGVAVAARAGRADALALFRRRRFAIELDGDDALSVAVWRERTDTVRLLLARGASVSADVLSPAERALTEVSEWTPHKSCAILEALRG
jgi:ankyrin repeat protein